MTATLGAIFSLEAVFVLSGVVLVIFAVFTFADRSNPARIGTGLFWLLLGIAFALGGVLPAWATGTIVIALAVIDGLGKVRHGGYGDSTPEERVRAADRLGWRIFVPVLMIPAVTYGASLAFAGQGIEPNRLVFVSLGYASLLAALVALWITRGKPVQLVDDGRRLADAIGAVVILPQLLASLGRLFRDAGVGDVISGLVTGLIPEGSLLAVVIVCSATVAVFTFIMGNSFAAFPVIMTGIGAPLLIAPFGADPALVGALVITVASCGTLCTPMAANFNIVPPALFEMKDQYGVIKFQAPYAMAMFVVHVVVMWGLIVAMG